MSRDALRTALSQTLANAALPEPADGVTLDPPKRRDQGDWSSPVALQLAKVVGAKPIDLAGRIKAGLDSLALPIMERVEVAPPGFVNIYLKASWLHDVVRDVVAAGETFGTSDALVGQRINLEFVSANPTGPLHAGGGRWVAVGDALANILASQGADVHREYYLNDAGTQLDTFGRSLHARYLGQEPPEDGYFGAYLLDMADRLRAALGDDVTEEEAREWGYHDVVRQLHDDLDRIGVHFDTWFSERTLHERGDVARVLHDLAALGVTFEH